MLIKYHFKVAFVLFFIISIVFPSYGQFDILILNGTVLDGKGGSGVLMDVGIEGENIVALGSLKDKEAKTVIDAKGLVITPGFIDLHAHIASIKKNPNALSALHQGVTTTLGGPDGSSPYPLDKYMESLMNYNLGVNVAYLVGHNTIRKKVMGLSDRDPNHQELEEMKGMVEKAMKDGAFGLSTGLKYLPGTFSKVEEVIELSKVASQYNGFYTSHLREEGLGLIPAVKEAILIGEKANIPIVLTHHKVVGKPSWGNSKTTLAMVDSANNKGLDVQLDQYPYTASYTGISILIPSWAMEGGQEMFLKRLEDEELKSKIKEEVKFNILNDRGAGDIKNIQFSKVSWDKSLENKRLSDWAVLKGLEPSVENGVELVLEAQKRGGASMIFHAMSDEDVERIMKHEKTMIASDGQLSVIGKGHPHPRAYGTFPRVLGEYARVKKVLTLEDAVRKMTYLPAQRMGLKNRGEIKVGNKADIVIFDAEIILDQSDFENPHQYPKGIKHVLVNGTVSIKNGKETGTYNGKVLKSTDVSERNNK